MLDLSIEAAVHLISCAYPLPGGWHWNALDIAQFAPRKPPARTVPACVVAQVFYQEGCLDQAEALLRDRLPVINANGPIECALRAYLVLVRIARQRKQYDFAALLLREAEALGERRNWPRLVAACLAERISLLLYRAGRQKPGSSLNTSIVMQSRTGRVRPPTCEIHRIQPCALSSVLG